MGLLSLLTQHPHSHLDSVHPLKLKRQMLPQAAGCGDGVTAHVRTFLHGGARITLSIATLPGAEALPGEDRGVVWTWLRPKGSNAEVARHVRRYGRGRGRSAGNVAGRAAPMCQPSCAAYTPQDQT